MLPKVRTGATGEPVIFSNAMTEEHFRNNIRKEIPEGFRAISECWDYDVRVKGGIMSKEAWIKEYSTVDAKLYKGRNDDAPFYAFMVYKFFKNHPEISETRNELAIINEFDQKR